MKIKRYKAIPDDEDGATLKAILGPFQSPFRCCYACLSACFSVAHDAITHQDHPLHIEGVKGIQLYHGMYLRCYVASVDYHYLVRDVQVHFSLEKFAFYSLLSKWNMYDTGSTR